MSKKELQYLENYYDKLCLEIAASVIQLGIQTLIQM